MFKGNSRNLLSHTPSFASKNHETEDFSELVAKINDLDMQMQQQRLLMADSFREIK